MRLLLYILIASFLVCAVIVIKREIFPGSDPNFPVKSRYLTDDELKNSIFYLARNNRVEDKYVGITGDISPLFDTFEYIASRASDEQLVQLTDHPNGCIRVYAFQALVQRENSNCRNILEKHVGDKTFFEYKSCDASCFVPVNYFYLLEARD